MSLQAMASARVASAFGAKRTRPLPPFLDAQSKPLIGQFE